MEQDTCDPIPLKDWTTLNFPGIAIALKQGRSFHCFSSGGGLRVVTLNKDNINAPGYGEHPYLNVAFQYADEDFRAGGREYSEVYGKLHPHYYTGDSIGTCDLDKWILSGHTLDGKYEDGKFIITAKGLKRSDIPREVLEFVYANKKICRYIDTERNLKYIAMPSTTPGGSRCVTIQSENEGMDGKDYFQNKEYVYSDKTLEGALQQAEKSLIVWHDAPIGYKIVDK